MKNPSALALLLTLPLACSSPPSRTLATESQWGHLKIATVSAEYKVEGANFKKTGGLGDAVGGLATAAKNEGYDIDVFMPGYASIGKNQDRLGEVSSTEHGARIGLDPTPNEGPFRKYAIFRESVIEPSHGPKVHVLAHQPGEGEPNYFDDTQGPYGPEAIKGEAFGAFGKAVAERLVAEQYDVVVLNDWHTGFVAAALRQLEAQGKRIPKIIFTVHNMAYTNEMPKEIVQFLGFDWRHFTPDGFEYHGRFSPFKAGMAFADLVVPVSEQHAREIQTEAFGYGLAGLARKIHEEGRMVGLLNGITRSEWDSTRKNETYYPFDYTTQTLANKARGKAWLQKRYGLAERADAPLFVLTSRITAQKGYAYLANVVKSLVHQRDAQVIIMADADNDFQGVRNELITLAKSFPDSLAVLDFKHNEAAEQSVTRYGDFLVNASFFEPCGLNQMYAMAVGTIPVVSAVGGLVDSVKDGVTGIHIPVRGSGENGHNQHVTWEAFERAMKLFKDKPAYVRMQQAAMAEKNGWENRMERFSSILERVLMAREELRATPFKMRNRPGVVMKPSPREASPHR